APRGSRAAGSRPFQATLDVPYGRHRSVVAVRGRTVSAELATSVRSPRGIGDELEEQARPRALAHDREELIREGVPAGRRRLLQLRDIRGTALVEQGEKQVLLALVAVIEGSLREADALGDLVHRRRLEPALGERLRRRGEQRLARGGVFLRARHPRPG